MNTTDAIYLISGPKKKKTKIAISLDNLDWQTKGRDLLHGVQ